MIASALASVLVMSEAVFSSPPGIALANVSITIRPGRRYAIASR